VDFTREGLAEATAQLDRFYLALDKAGERSTNLVDATWEAVKQQTAAPPADLLAALEDDLNTPLALSHLHEAATRLNKAESAAEKEAARAGLLAGGKLLGLLRQRPAAWLKGGETEGPDAAAIEARIAERLAARKAKDFATADRIRDELAAEGVLLEDGPKGTSWRRVG
jgi:cysteinyl-tRNA synthetase